MYLKKESNLISMGIPTAEQRIPILIRRHLVGPWVAVYHGLVVSSCNLGKQFSCFIGLPGPIMGDQAVSTGTRRTDPGETIPQSPCTALLEGIACHWGCARNSMNSQGSCQWYPAKRALSAMRKQDTIDVRVNAFATDAPSITIAVIPQSISEAMPHAT